MLLNGRFANFLLILLAPLALVSAAPPAAAQGESARYDESMASGLYAEAEDVAKTRLARALATGSRRDPELASLYIDLAAAQRLRGDFDTAIQNYELAVDVIEYSSDRLNLAICEALLGIGDAYVASRRPDLALPYLDRALHVRQVNDGLHSMGQVSALESLLQAYRNMGDGDKAADVAERLYLLYERRFSADSLEVVPMLVQKGRVLGEFGNRREERNTYNDALGVVERREGKSSVHRIEPLISLGRSHQDEYFEQLLRAEAKEELPDEGLLRTAELHFEAALETARSSGAENWQRSTDALLAMADFQTLRHEHARARLLYREAWQLLSADEERLLRRQRELESAVPLMQPPPDLTVGLPEGVEGSHAKGNLVTGFIVTSATVTRRGRMADIALVEIQPERNAALEEEVKLSLARSVYRPRFENGNAVETRETTRRFEFPYPDPALGKSPSVASEQRQ
jgi:tetratricopeptide (TPR) repeat protein